MENIQVNEEKNPSGVESESPANRAGQASVLERRVREITADPNHYPQTSKVGAQENADWILGYAAQLSTEWKRISANVSKGDPNLFWVAETLAFWGLGEARKEPHHFETRRDWSTGESKQVGFGCICYFRIKPESLEAANA